MKIMRIPAAIPAWSKVTVALFSLTVWSVTPTWASDPLDPNQSLDEIHSDDGSSPNRLYAPSQVVVRFKVGAEPAEFVGEDPVRTIADTMQHGRTYLLELDPDASVDSAATALGQMHSVEYKNL